VLITLCIQSNIIVIAGNKSRGAFLKLGVDVKHPLKVHISYIYQKVITPKMSSCEVFVLMRDITSVLGGYSSLSMRWYLKKKFVFNPEAFSYASVCTCIFKLT